MDRDPPTATKFAGTRDGGNAPIHAGRLAIGSGGGSGIRTHDTVSRIHAFQACAFSHSATPPDIVGRCAHYSHKASSDNPNGLRAKQCPWIGACFRTDTRGYGAW